MTLYLAWFDRGDGPPPDFGFKGQAFALRDGLYLVESALTQSRVYHSIKRGLPPDTALIVGTLADQPKFKGMDAGALKWVRGL